mgnify:CR=1 FL=1
MRRVQTCSLHLQNSAYCNDHTHCLGEHDEAEMLEKDEERVYLVGDVFTRFTPYILHDILGAIKQLYVCQPFEAETIATDAISVPEVSNNDVIDYYHFNECDQFSIFIEIWS